MDGSKGTSVEIYGYEMAAKCTYGVKGCVLCFEMQCNMGVVDYKTCPTTSRNLI